MVPWIIKEKKKTGVEILELTSMNMWPTGFSSVVLLRGYGSPGFSDRGLQLSFETKKLSYFVHDHLGKGRSHLNCFSCGKIAEHIFILFSCIVSMYF